MKPDKRKEFFAMSYHSDFPILSVDQSPVRDKILIPAESLDFILILSGRIYITLPDTQESRAYETLQLALLHSRQSYILESDRHGIVLRICLAPEFFYKFFGTDHRILCDSALEPNRDYQKIRNLLSGIAVLYTDPQQGSELAILSLFYQLLDDLSKNFCIQAAEKEPFIRQKYDDRIQSIQAYINLNYHKPLTLGMMAEEFHLSPQYLSHFFKKTFSIRFREYLNEIRIQHAAHALSHTRDSITDIALNNGFPNITLFTKNFRDYYGIAPNAYRQEQRQNCDLTSGTGLESVSPASLSDSHGYQRKISVSVSKTVPFRNHFCALVNAGYAQNFLHNSFREHLLESKKQLHFSYVRIEGLVSSTIIPRLSSNNRFYFSTAAQILDFMYDKQLIPFIELGKNSFNYLTLADENRSVCGYCATSRFHKLLAAFLEFVRDRYNSSWYSQWIFELWKTPYEPMELYLKGYQQIERLLDDILPGVRLGGPGYNTSQPPEVFDELLSGFQKYGIRPDFLSVHIFMIQKEINTALQKPVIHTDIRSMQAQQKRILAQAAAAGQTCPLYITEFNSSLLTNTFINASSFQSTWLCSCLPALLERSPLAGYWLLDDMALNNAAFYHMNIRYPLRANLGLINRFGIRMPSFYAYMILDKLGNSLIEKGDDYYITRSTDEHFQILAYHYCPILPENAPDTDETLSLLDTYLHFQPSQEKEVSICLTDICPGTYRITRYLLNQDHGSLLDIEMQGLRHSTVSEELYLRNIQMPSSRQRKYLSETIQPEERTIYVEAQKDLRVHTALKPHTVCLWDIVYMI